MLEEKNGYVQSFSKKLEEHTASTTTLSESSVWVIENIISGKCDLSDLTLAPDWLNETIH